MCANKTRATMRAFHQQNSKPSYLDDTVAELEALHCSDLTKRNEMQRGPSLAQTHKHQNKTAKQKVPVATKQGLIKKQLRPTTTKT